MHLHWPPMYPFSHRLFPVWVLVVSKLILGDWADLFPPEFNFQGIPCIDQDVEMRYLHRQGLRKHPDQISEERSRGVTAHCFWFLEAYSTSTKYMCSRKKLGFQLQSQLCLLYFSLTHKIHKKLPKEQTRHITDYYLHQAKKVTLITLFQKHFPLRSSTNSTAPVWAHWHARLTKDHTVQTVFLLCSHSSVCSALHLSQPNYRVFKYLGSSCPLNGFEFFLSSPKKTTNQV